MPVSARIGARRKPIEPRARGCLPLRPEAPLQGFERSRLAILGAALRLPGNPLARMAKW